MKNLQKLSVNLEKIFLVNILKEEKERKKYVVKMISMFICEESFKGINKNKGFNNFILCIILL